MSNRSRGAAPVPPSTVAVPTRHDDDRSWQPRSAAVQISSPTPERRGSHRIAVFRLDEGEPHADALSMIAVSASIQPNSA